MSADDYTGPAGDRLAAGPPGALRFPAAERNKQAILEALERILPARGLVLEIASGTGQHVAHFAAALTGLVWQPSEPDEELRASIRAYLAQARLANAREPLDLDVLESDWPVATADAIVCINMIHVAPWSATDALFAGASRALGAGGVVVLYGPFKAGRRHTAPSNAAFDAALRSQNADWGVRDVDDVSAAALGRGFALVETIPMPANNFVVAYRRLG